MCAAVLWGKICGLLVSCVLCACRFFVFLKQRCTPKCSHQLHSDQTNAMNVPLSAAGEAWCRPILHSEWLHLHRPTFIICREMWFWSLIDHVTKLVMHMWAKKALMESKCTWQYQAWWKVVWARDYLILCHSLSFMWSRDWGLLLCSHVDYAHGPNAQRSRAGSRPGIWSGQRMP